MIADPINQLIAAGATPRMLIEHFIVSVEWLAQHQGDTFRLCYHDEAGEVVVETVTAVSLLIRGRELGWKPTDDEPTEAGAPYLFDEPVYHCRRGVHWYASAMDDSNAMLPLAWPASVLRANVKREERERAAYRRCAAAKQKKADKEQAKQRRTARRESMESLIRYEMNPATQAGKAISRRLARRRVNALIADICKGGGTSKPDVETATAVACAVASNLQKARVAVSALPSRAQHGGPQ
ncbi:hypothetical protein HDC36_003409 [Xanthomonas sp. JAI131]|uniref:hypothetical protein n=1 Tax=Xanthomonas sp. JAI131 TaxID=2723067 RepID=UPI0015C9F8B7|nr:hypothetical protein [Xanthomonas sp. JAI131]NYF21933.1 hypothetical protein [Xanthomonas sp. JAI131]